MTTMSFLQPTFNIGMLGSVSHGKSSIVKALSGVATQRFQAELKRNITIQLGYANCKIYQCNECIKKYTSTSGETTIPPLCKSCHSPMELKKFFSFVDCPGHDAFSSVMIGGSSVMDACLFVVASDEPCPQPQTLEHLAVLDLTDVSSVVVVQNKIDLVSKETATTHHNSIKQLITNTSANSSPIIPVSTPYRVNFDVLCDLIVKIPEPIRDTASSPVMLITRSFDINRPGMRAIEMKGGVVGGSVVSGVFKLGQEVEIRPGRIYLEAGMVVCKPLRTMIASIRSEKIDLDVAYPGGLISFGTMLMPDLCKRNKLVGHIVGVRGQLPSVYNELSLSVKFIKGLENIMKPDETWLLTEGSFTTLCDIVICEKDKKKYSVKIKLRVPLCTAVGKRVCLSRRVDKSWKVSGVGKVLDGNVICV